MDALCGMLNAIGREVCSVLAWKTESRGGSVEGDVYNLGHD
jgi:hypothetical protein